MIYIIGISEMKRKDGKRVHPDAPEATIFIIQRPFSALSLGPLVSDMSREETVASLQEYKKWLMRVLIMNQKAITEFTRMLDVFIEEGDIVLQCSCTNIQFCHGNLIRDALIWASQFGIEEWHNQLKMINVPK